MEVAMTVVLGACQLARHVINGSYILLRYSFNEQNGFDVLVEPFIEIDKETFQQRGYAVVLGSLHSPVGLNFKEVSYFDNHTKRKLLELKRKHLLLYISLSAGDQGEEMKIIPEHGQHGWRFTRFPDEIRTYRLPITQASFIEAIGQAFGIAN
jgi:hypothetical protein